MQLYTVDSAHSTLTPVQTVSAIGEGLGETKDLEAWIRTQDNIFDRKRLLWLSRQERTEVEQRADLLGMYADELILVELKRGRVDKFAVAQALSYLAKHASDDRQQLLDLFIKQAGNTGQWALLPAPMSAEDAEKRFNSYEPAGPSEEINQFRTIILLGDDFDPETLQICNLLNESARTDGLLTFECWCLCLFRHSETYFCAFDKLLPSKDLDDEIEQRRSDLLVRKGKRNSEKIDFMKSMKALARQMGIEVEASRGESYACRFSYKSKQEANFDTRLTPTLGVAVSANEYDLAAFQHVAGVTSDGQNFRLSPVESFAWNKEDDRKKAADEILNALGVLFRIPKAPKEGSVPAPAIAIQDGPALAPN
ncbi:MAG: hypothetical protein WDO13_18120 [Verrucomicrobiota bacterium]